jgi:5-methylcytosine-specific restriction endonuclease McrA
MKSDNWKDLLPIGPRVTVVKKKKTWEADMFREIWNERPHLCELCWKILREAKAHNFDHIIPKSRGEEYRLNKTNIALVCFSCHFNKTTLLKYKWPDLD